MSIEVMSLVWSRKIGSPTRKAVLQVMADAANSDGQGVWLSKPSIAARSEVSEKTVKRAISDLSDEGLIRVSGKRRISNGFVTVYALDLDAIKALPRSQSDGGQIDRGDTVTPDRGTECPPTPGHSDPQTTLEPPLNHAVVDRARDPDLRERLESGLREAAGNAVNWHCQGIAVLNIPLGWIMGANPVDLDLDLLPTVRAVCQARGDPKPIRSWNYFRDAVFEARDQRLSPNPEPQETRNARPNPHSKSDALDNATRAALASMGIGQGSEISGFRESGQDSRLASTDSGRKLLSG